MARYWAVPQMTAEWVLSKPAILNALHEAILGHESTVAALTTTEVVEGPVRLSTSPDGVITAFWNVDYLSGTGEESWGFIRTTGEYGLASEPQISQEVLERTLYVINQRLQGLFIDGAFIHRAHGNGAHTCIAGRGTAARQMNIAYVERSPESSGGQHTLLAVGPGHDFTRLTQVAVEAGTSLDRLLRDAQALISPNRKRTVADANVLAIVRHAIAPFVQSSSAPDEYGEVEVSTDSTTIDDRSAYSAYTLEYRHWMTDDSPLSEVQRRILFSPAIERHPLRIVGPGGSGKTLLMQLLALRRLEIARVHNSPLRVMYIAHNAAMAETVKTRFALLQGGVDSLTNDDRVLDVSTLAEYGRQQLGLDYNAVIDSDAHEAKRFQLEQVEDALIATMAAMPAEVNDSRLFAEVKNNSEFMPVIARLLMAEISSAIKGHGLDNDRQRYVLSERHLSRLHGILSQAERELVYSVFERYHRTVFEGYEVLDSDDIALSLLGRLRTPIWELKRRKLGYDYVFVDETQLFNENERRVLPLLTNGLASHVPIVLALDEAQDVYGQSSAGMGTLGIPDITNESLPSIHRSTRAIIRLAFFVIQRSTDLFGPDFPDFTGIAEQMAPDTHPLAAEPMVEVVSDETRFAKSVVRRVRELRKANLRRLAVICHADQYWDQLQQELTSTDLPVQVLLERGTRIVSDNPVVILSRPAYVGGQEFDAVVLVGLEQGLVPPRIPDNDALAAAVEQQSLREMYLSITRARYRLIVLISPASAPTAILQDATAAGLLTSRSGQLPLFTT